MKMKMDLAVPEPIDLKNKVELKMNILYSF